MFLWWNSNDDKGSVTDAAVSLNSWNLRVVLCNLIVGLSSLWTAWFLALLTKFPRTNLLPEHVRQTGGRSDDSRMPPLFPERAPWAMIKVFMERLCHDDVHDHAERFVVAFTDGKSCCCSHILFHFQNVQLEYEQNYKQRCSVRSRPKERTDSRFVDHPAVSLSSCCSTVSSSLASMDPCFLKSLFLTVGSRVLTWPESSISLWWLIVWWCIMMSIVLKSSGLHRSSTFSDPVSLNSRL